MTSLLVRLAGKVSCILLPIKMTSFVVVNVSLALLALQKNYHDAKDKIIDAEGRTLS
jgi:hypothetical protein